MSCENFRIDVDTTTHSFIITGIFFTDAGGGNWVAGTGGGTLFRSDYNPSPAPTI